MSDLAPSIRPLSDRLSWPPGVPVPGDIIGGKYLCERLLGAGGMGAVIGARHEQLGQQVAIKVLLPSALTDPLASERFLREARAAISFRSDHVARVIDFGTLDAGSPYLVMEHLEGSDLKDLISRKGPLPVASAIDYIMQACEALCEAHRRGIVHRDLKPANLFLSSRVDGTPHVKVLDFGISKTVSLAAASTGSGGGITRTDAVFGTPAYMSPEQLRSSKLVDHRTDVWSLGASLFELLTGSLPFGSPHDGIASMCAHILEDPPPALQTLRPEVPGGLNEIVQRCMAKNPADRYPNIASLAEAMLPFGSSMSEEAAGRIARMAADSLPFDSTVKGDSLPAPSRNASATANSWGTTSNPTMRKKLVRLGTAGLAATLFALALGGAWLLGNRSAANPSLAVPSASASSFAFVALVPENAVVPTAQPSATSSAVAAEATASAATQGSKPATSGTRLAAPKPEPIKSSAPAQPACSPNQVVSNGHCCPSGFEWKGGTCTPGVAKVLKP